MNKKNIIKYKTFKKKLFIFWKFADCKLSKVTPPPRLIQKNFKLKLT